jgi:acyl-CoA thioesterase-1
MAGDRIASQGPLDAAACSRASSTPKSSSGSAALSSALSAGRSWNDWKTKPTSSPRSFASSSSSSFESCRSARVISPRVGRSSPASSPNSVDFPDPDSPTIASDCPVRSSKETSLRMVRSCAPSGTSRVTLWARSTKESVLGFMVAIALMLAAPERVVLVYGDSLSAGYGMRAEESWPSLLQQRLGKGYKVVNASVSGETSAGGLTRLPSALREHRPSLVVLELGGNDGLRGLPLEALEKNLAAMIDECRKAGAKVLLLGIELPPNFGPSYVEKFRAVFPSVAARFHLPPPPPLLEGFSDRAQFQADQIHPTAQAEPRLLENVWPAISRLAR